MLVLRAVCAAAVRQGCQAGQVLAGCCSGLQEAHRAGEQRLPPQSADSDRPAAAWEKSCVHWPGSRAS